MSLDKSPGMRDRLPSFLVRHSVQIQSKNKWHDGGESGLGIQSLVSTVLSRTGVCHALSDRTAPQ